MSKIKITLNVDGMTCHGCENIIENSLKDKKAISKVKADFKEKKVE